MLANASNELRALAELTGIPTVTTLMGRGALPDEHPLCLGMPGMHGNFTAVTAMQKADLLITLGARFDDRVTGKVSSFAPDAKVIHVDIDPAELGKVRHADVPIVGDLRTVIDEMIKALKTERAKHDPPDLEPWLATIHDWQDRSSRSSSSRPCATTPRTTASSWPGWVSTRCGRVSSGSSSCRTRG
jgi:acetolactate synthase-1/2/3 large subunit